MPINIAIDGPAGAGKSTISRTIAEKFGLIHLDTGALYRSIGYFFVEKGISTTESNAIVKSLNEISLEMKFIDKKQHMILNGVDITEKLRSPEVSMATSDVSSVKEVREFLLHFQQDLAKNNDIIIDGRDIGTVILPEANIKIFLTASPEERANRRLLELQEKGETDDYDKVLAEIIERDRQDSEREIAPLKQASDAYLFDTSANTLEKSTDLLLDYVQKEIDLIKINASKKQKSKAKLFFYGILKLFILGVFKICYNLKYEGKSNIPKDGGYVFACNHRTYIDPIIVALGGKIPCCFMAKEELFRKKAFALLIRTFGAFPVERGKGDMAVIDESVKRICNGNNLLIFPEGTRSKDGTVGKGKSGVALIASKVGSDVIPVAISFTGKLKFRSKIIVTYGVPIKASELKLNSPRDLKRLKGKIMDAITELVENNVDKVWKL